MLQYLQDLKPDFKLVTEQRDRLEMLIEIGKDLGDFPPRLKTEENRVPGCVSGVFISSEVDANGKMHFQGCSESLIVKGFVKILLDTLNGLTPKEVIDAETDIQEFLDKTGLGQSLLATRANAFGNIFVMMKEKARTFL